MQLREDFEDLVFSKENEHLANRHGKGEVVGRKSGFQEGFCLSMLSLGRDGPCEWKYLAGNTGLGATTLEFFICMSCNMWDFPDLG